MSTQAAKRLYLLDNHLQPHKTAASASPTPGNTTTTTKTLISSILIKDGDYSYPEILDYHPEKKVTP
jgi:hypothetical protein